MTTLLLRRCVTTLLFAANAMAVGQQAQSTARSIAPSESVQITPLSPIHTESFIPQVIRSFVKRDVEVENEIDESWLSGKARTRNQLTAGRIAGQALPRTAERWPGMGATGWTPADATLAVGPNNVVVTVNCAIAFFSRNGALQFQQDFGSFFDGLNATGFRFDPRVAYDPLAKRYYAIALELSQKVGVSKVLLAVSDDDDPKGIWYRYRMEAKFVDGPTQFWLDYPGFGFNKDALVISGNLFAFEGSDRGGTLLAAIPKAPLLKGSAATASYFRDPDAFSYQMAEIAESNVNAAYGVSVFDWTRLKVCAISDLSTTPKMTTWFVSVPSIEFGSRFATGLGGTLDTLDGRLLSSSFRGGRLLTAHATGIPGRSDHQVRWYELDVLNAPAAAPTLVQAGNVAPPNAGEHYFMPAVNKNAAGEVSVLFTKSTPTTGPESMVAARAKNDPIGEMRAPFRMASSNTGGDGRWGDYFKIVVDPVDNRTFWGISMLAVGGPFRPTWRTEVSRWTLTPTISTLQVPTTIPSGATVTGTVTLTSPASKDMALFLTSDQALITVPAKIKIAAGDDLAQFQVRAGTTAQSQDVTITATLSEATATAKTRVLTPRPDLELSRTTTEGGSGETTILSVRLSDPAPSGGVKVTLGSSSPLLVLPPEMKVPAGKSSASLSFTCLATPANVEATVSATWGNNTRTRKLTITPPEVESLVLSASFVGGSDTEAIGRIRLTRPAPASGVAVRLTSNSPVITVSDVVTVEGGATTADFTLQHVSVAKMTVAKVSAVSGVRVVLQNVTVNPPYLDRFKPTSYSLEGGLGQSVACSVTLNAPAPSEGIKVSFLLSDPALQLSPSPVTIPAGQTTVTVTATAPTAVTTNRLVHIQAIASGRDYHTDMTVEAIKLVGVSLDPVEVVGGSITKVSLTVTLSAKAPAGGVTVSLSSADPAVATVPTTLVVPAGQTSATVEVTHADVTANKKVWLSAELNGVKKSLILLVRR